jgi:glycosyltransferase involved in cell wall biosynthesis
MRILFNQMATMQLKTGVGHYAHQLRQQLSQRSDCELNVFPTDRWMRWTRRLRRCLKLADTWPARRDSQTATGNGNAERVEPGSRYGWARRRYRQWVARSQRKAFFSDLFDLYHEPNFIPVPTSLPIVATVHDLSVLLHPEWHPADRVRWYEEEFSRSLSRVTHIITVSEFTRQQVIRVLGVAHDRVTSVANGPRPEFRPLAREAVDKVLRRRGLTQQYLLYVGTIEPRKNILRLMQAYISLPARLRRDWPLILVGGWGWNINAERAFYEEVAAHEGVRHLGYLPDEDLPALFNGARALVYPSLYEGFGLPPLEMMACGGAVLASNIPPHVEVTGGAAHLIDPEDTEGWREAIAKVILDEDWRQNLCTDAVARAREFSWVRCAQETTEVYRRVLEPDDSSGCGRPSRFKAERDQHAAGCQNIRADAA